MGYRRVRVHWRTNAHANSHANSNGNTNRHSYPNARSDSDSNAYTHADPYAVTYSYAYANRNAYANTLRRDSPELHRKENPERADDLAKRRIYHDGNHQRSAGAQNRLAELAARLPARLLDDGDFSFGLRSRIADSGLGTTDRKI